MSLFEKIEKSRDFWMLLGISIIFFFLRFPSLFEPYWYGDEGIYQVVAMAMRAGRLLYRDIWDNKPPLLYLIYALFNSDQFLIRLASLCVGIATVIVFFALAKKLFSPRADGSKPVLIATVLFGTGFATPLLEGNIANAENFMILPITSAALLIFLSAEQRLRRTRNIKIRLLSILSGFLLSLGFLLKAIAVFDAAAFVVFLFIIEYKNKEYLTAFLYRLFFFSVGFLFPILITVLFFTLNGALMDFIKAAFVQNVGYVGYGNSLIIPQGFLVLKLVFLALAMLLLFRMRKNIDTPAIFIAIWLCFSLFNAFFSARPYTHYLLVLLPSFCLLTGAFFWNKKYQKGVAVGLLFILIAIANNFWIYAKTISYYQNFLAFLKAEKSTTAYQSFFDSNTPKDYLIAQFLKMHTKPSDQVLIWGNNAQVYTLIHKLPPGRFTVVYHMSFSPNARDETAKAIEMAAPKYIVVMGHQTSIPYTLARYSLSYTIDATLIYERTL